MGRILIVEDDARLATLLTDLLEQTGHDVSVCARGDEAVGRILGESPDLVILDLTLPGLDGLDVCRQVRSRFDGRILVLTARGDEIDEIVGLELGADDYLAKPVAPRRLVARVAALLRRGVSASDGVLRNGPLEVDGRRRVASLHGTPLQLSTAEFDLLVYLTRRTGEVVSRDALYRDLRGLRYDGIDRSIDLRVSRLRKHLKDDSADPAWIKTVHGVGYIMPPMA